MESIERIMIRAEVFWQAVPANRSLEHAAQRHTINDAAVNAKPDETTCKLVHHENTNATPSSTALQSYAPTRSESSTGRNAALRLKASPNLSMANYQLG